MVVNSLKALMFVTGGAAVAAGAAYVTGALDLLFPQTQQVASAPQPESTGAQPPAALVGQPGAGKPAEQQMAALPAGGNAPAAADPATSGKQDRVVVPSFDLVRVEPDGSVVIAGQAAPNAKVEVVTGSSVIGADKAGPGGDFAVVLDDPLKPGDYTIVLRSTTPDNVVATSEETAIVSVPQDSSGQVLALVEKPGAASKLITVPQAQPAAEKQDRPATSGTPAAEAQQVAAAAQQPAPPAAGPASQEKPAGQQAASGTDAAAPAVAGAPAAVQPGQMAALPVDKQEPPVADKPAGQAQASAESPAAVSSGGPQQAAAQAGQPEQAAVAAPAGGQQVAAAQPEAPKPAPAAEKPRISVEAVEIEGSRVFVAGRAEPGGHVRVYANDILLGDATASPGGQFLVEAQRELPVGDYIVRADLLGPRAEVLARAAVPFEREPGESIAAVASPEPAAQGPVAPKPQAGAPKAEAAAQQQPAAAEAASVQASEAPAGQGAAPAQGGQQTAAAAADAPKADGGQPASVSAPADPAAPAGDGAVIASAADAQDVTAPKLKSVAGAVIIRRGDTLWRISRRVYGLGVRYTTIYLANQDQISDPDRIWPGQVFSVPDKTGDGEQADLSAVADRVVPVE